MFKRIVLVVVTLLLSSSNALTITDPQNFMLLPNNIVGIIGNTGLSPFGILSPYVHIENTQDGNSSSTAIRIQRSITGQNAGTWGLGGTIDYPMGFDIGYPNLIIGGNWVGLPFYGNFQHVGYNTLLLMHRLDVGF